MTSGGLDPNDPNSTFTLPTDDLVFTLQATALQDLTVNSTVITTEAADGSLAEITVLGSNDDQRSQTEFGSLTAE